MRRISGRLLTGLAAALVIAGAGPLAAQSDQSEQTKVDPQRVDIRAEAPQRVSLPPRLAGLRGEVHLPKYRTFSALQPLTWVPSSADTLLDEAAAGQTAAAASGLRSSARTSGSTPASSPSGDSSGEIATASTPTPAGAGAELDEPVTTISRPPAMTGARGEIRRPAYAYTATVDDPTKPSSHGSPKDRQTVYSPGPTIPDPGGTGSDGWTPLVKAPDTRVVYVSSSEGSDLNNGLSETTPVKTIAKGKSLVRMGYPDWLLLKRGDEWVESFGRWDLYGRSETERIVVSAYGEGARPLLKCGASEGFSAIRNVIAHVIFTDLDFWAHTRDPSQSGFNPSDGEAGFYVLGAAKDLTIEGCRFRFFETGLVLQANGGGAPTEINVRRSAILDSYNVSGHAQGIFALGTRKLLLEENIFDHNGWHPWIPGAEPTMFNHNVYSKGKSGLEAEDFVARGNIFSNASSFGLTASSEGHRAQRNPLVEENLFLRNANGFVHGSSVSTGIAATTIRNNVFLDHGRVLKGLDQSLGVLVGGVDGAIISGNVFAHKPSDSTSKAIALEKGGQSYRNVRIDSNVIHGWNKGRIAIESTNLHDVVVRGNLIVDPFGSKELQHLVPGATGVFYEGNRYKSAERKDHWFYVDAGFKDLRGWISSVESVDERELTATLKDPSRDVAAYDSTVGGSGSVESFLARVRDMSRRDWDPRLTGAAASGWIREGFGSTE